MIALAFLVLALSLPSGEHILVPGTPPNTVEVHDEAGAPVLRIRSDRSASSVVFRLGADAQATPRLRWRWKVDRVIAGADLARKEGDDFAARVYVSFDVPLETLPFAERVKVRLARLVYGPQVPTAALCYVWDNRHAPGTTAWNPFSQRLRMVVVRSGGEGAGRWHEESRDVAADFRAAFGTELSGPVPRITGIALGADTDQTGEAVTAWFAGVTLEARP